MWLCHRVCLSFHEDEELLIERGITVTHETVRQWWQKFGPGYAHKLKKRQGRLGDIWPSTKSLWPFRGQRHYLYGAIDQDGDVIDNWAQSRRNQRAAERVLRRILKSQSGEPRWLITDQLRSYAAAHRTRMSTVKHLNHSYANNRAEVSHEPTQQRERPMRGFRSSDQVEEFLARHSLTQNVFRLGRHLMQAVNYRLLRARVFQGWQETVCA